MYTCAIFDLDGTLVDSMEYWTIAPEEYLKRKGVNPPKDISSTFLSISLREAAILFKEKFGITDDIDTIMYDISEVMHEFYLNKVELKKGMYDLLVELEKRNIKMAIATSTEKYLVEEVVKKLKIDKFIDYITTCSIVGASKNKPDVYISCCEYFNTKISETFVFEDLPHGLGSAKNAGFFAVGLFDKPSKNLQEKIIERSDLYLLEMNKESIQKIIDLIDKGI